MRFAVLCSVAIFASGVARSADGPTFDAASVKLASPDTRPRPIDGGPGTNDPGRFSASRISMVPLLRRAFDVADDQIVGPGWLRNNPAPEYTVLATMPADTPKEQFLKMLQNLLVERFHLAFHHETRNFPGYELVVDKGGPKFKETTPTPAANTEAKIDIRAALSGAQGEDGFPSAPGSRRISQNLPGGQARLKFQEWTMADFASNLQPLIAMSQIKGPLPSYFLRPRVADKTGLTGKYTFILEYYDASAANLDFAAIFGRGGAASDTANGSPPAAREPGNGFPNIFVAVQKQLGLRLDKTADIPLDVIVVDSVDKAPTNN